MFGGGRGHLAGEAEEVARSRSEPLRGLIVEGRAGTKESPFESGAGPSPEAWSAKSHILRPQVCAILIDMNEQGVSVRLEVDEDCWSMCTKWIAPHGNDRLCEGERPSVHLKGTVLKRICMQLLPARVAVAPVARPRTRFASGMAAREGRPANGASAQPPARPRRATP